MKKFESIVRGLSFGEQYLVATIVYLGLSLMLIGSMPEMEVALANSGGCTHQVPVYVEGVLVGYDTVPGCPDGQMCCGGSCIGSGWACCINPEALHEISFNTATHRCCNGAAVYDFSTHKCCCDGVKTIDECCDCD